MQPFPYDPPAHVPGDGVPSATAGCPPTGRTSPLSAKGLAALGVQPDRIYVDHDITDTHRHRPGLREALAACRRGDTLAVTKLDRLARSVPDGRDIVDELTARGVRLDLGGSVHDPTDPIGRLLFTVLSMIAELEADLARARTREGMALAKAKGRLRGKQPKLKPTREAQLVGLWRAGSHTTSAAKPCTAVSNSSRASSSNAPCGRRVGRP